MKSRAPWINLIINLILFSLFLFLQTLLGHKFIVASTYIPNLAFIIFLYYAVQCGNLGYLVGFVAGLMVQPLMLPEVVWGIYPFVYTVIGYIAGHLKGKIVVDSFIMPFLYLLGAQLIELLLVFLFSLLPDVPRLMPTPLNGFLHTIITLAFSIPIYNLLNWTRLIDLNERKGH